MIDRQPVSGTHVLRILLSVFLPPLGVFLTVGLEPRFWINLLLTFFGYLPGLIHAVWVIARSSDDGWSPARYA